MFRAISGVTRIVQFIPGTGTALEHVIRIFSSNIPDLGQIAAKAKDRMDDVSRGGNGEENQIAQF